jgi:hypothetical protein
LRLSHFIPQAAYKLVRGKGKNPTGNLAASMSVRRLPV